MRRGARTIALAPFAVRPWLNAECAFKFRNEALEMSYVVADQSSLPAFDFITIVYVTSMNVTENSSSSFV